MRSALATLLFACLSSGCSSDRDAIEKRLSELREDIRKLQANNDSLATRLDSLETRVAASTPSSSPTSTAEARVERPPLRVVKLVPGGDGDNAVVSDDAPTEVKPEERPDAPGQRPVIRLRGKGGDGVDALARQSSQESP